MKRRLLIPAGVLVLAAAAAVAWKLGLDDGGESGLLEIYGNVDIRQVDLAFRVSGRVQGMNAEEGDRVAAGATLATLDSAPLQHELDLARAELDAQRANLDKLESGSRVEEITQARARVRELEAALDNARRHYERQAKLLKQGVVPQRVYDQALAAKTEVEARLAAARAARDLAVEGFRAEDVLSASAQLRAAQARVALAETRVADATLTTPATGVVLTRAVEPGAIVAAGSPVYTLSLESPVWVRTYVDEPDLGRVHAGMKALVLTDSGGRYEGRVGFISPEAEFTPKSVQTTDLRTALVYRLRVVVDAPDSGLRRGMPVTVRIRLDGKSHSP